jgi:glycine/D-amino acid oxidase-like deaminating enzyme
VVVGGGIVGASVVHHVARRGWDELVLIDQGSL